jgi:hypothetical protein
MNALATPSVVCEHGRQRTKCPDCEVIALEGELAEAGAKNAALLIERNAAFKMSKCECGVEECCGNLIAADDRAEKAEAKNAALMALLERCRPAAEFVSTSPIYVTELQEIHTKLLTKIDAALKEGK